jgi:hypothetical protein
LQKWLGRVLIFVGTTGSYKQNGHHSGRYRKTNIRHGKPQI